ncbi:SET domain-containing protein [Rhizopus microsporus]|uniref:SET domain-containing protein n=1 Tax=Rhizopus microsporus TaxID=58291 RepID=A0A1X0RU08_RHIZD|nr:SET domain-containing protein [Rhizopus microsporus]
MYPLDEREKTDTTHDNNTAASSSSSSSSSSPQTTDGPCTDCHTVDTPQWRRGPHGYRTLCNACGLRWAKQQNGLTNNSNKSVPKKKSKPKKRKHGDSLFDKKEYITHGLYSAETRGVPTLTPQAFHVPLPIHQGEIILSTVKDFELPPYVLQERELDLIESLVHKPPRFKKIKTNIFVGRKPRTSEKYSVTCHCKPPEKEDEVGCGDSCLNRMLFYECDLKCCPCGKECTNRRFHKDQVETEVEVFRTEKRGWGLRTKEDIKKGQFIIEYCGEIISRELCEERMCTTYVNEKNFYFLEYSKGEVIDACTKGTEARFINHSCDPNCHIEKWSYRGEAHFGVFASKDIPAYTELSYDYNFLTFNVENAQVCHCGSKRCRGIIGKKITGKRTRS